MKAVFCPRYGPPEVLEIREVPKPAPKDHELLVKVRATTVNAGDWRVRSGEFPPGFGLVAKLGVGFSGPRHQVLGTELAGEVEAVGRAVTGFQVGDRVFASCGFTGGCHAEYKCVSEHKAVALKPANLSFEEAAAIPFGGLTALSFLLHKGRLQAGEKVLINGASGGVGTAAVQVARHYGAEVTGVCSARNLDLVRSIGAHHVIDYTRTDFSQNGQTYDVIVDAVGTAPLSRSRRSLKKSGRLLVVLGTLPQMLLAPWQSLTSRVKVISGIAGELPEDMRTLAKMAETGAFKPVIDHVFPYEKIAEAHRRVETGHKVGNVVVTF